MMKTWMGLSGAALVLLASAACSPHRQPPVRPAESPAAMLTRADALRDGGCYVCLRDARDLYRALLDQGFRPAATRDRLMRTTAMMAAREREAGIAPTADPDVINEPAAPGAIPFSAVAAAIPWRLAGISNVFPGREDARRPTALASWRSQLQAAASAGDQTAAYLFATLDCAWPVPTPGSAAGASPPPASSSPAVAFARASCGAADEATLRALVQAEPRFVEADFLLAVGALRRREPDAAEARLRHVASLLPSLLAAPTTLGDLLSDAEDFEEALDFYDQALGFAPDHREALLGRARCLGNLNRNREALETCDTMIRLGAWYLGPAYYWRAWNLHSLKEIEPAWQAIEKSKQYIQNADVFELSGLIAFDRGDAAQTRADMTEALRRNDRMCRPTFYLGLLDTDVEAWAGAAPRFVAAERCYDASASAASERAEEVRRSAMPDARKRRVIERLRGQVAAASRGKALAAYRAAVSYAGTGQVAEALEHAARARGDDALRKQAEDLIARLKR